MSAFETTYNIISISALAPNADALEAGADPLVLVRVTPGLMLPMEDPTRPGHPVVVPIGNVQYRLAREGAIEFGETLIEEGSKLPVTPGLGKVDVATSMADAQRLADRLGSLAA